MAASNQSPFEVEDFRLGLTDDPFETDPRFSIQLDNFDIEPDGSLRSRYGSVIEDETEPQITTGVERIGAIINYDNSAHLLVQSQTHIFFRDTVAYSELLGPTSNDVFSTGDETNNVAFSEWNKQVFITNDAFARPMKIYKGGSPADLYVNTSGLPALATAPTVTPSAGTNAYIYAFHHSYTFEVGSQSFEDLGPITQVSTTLADSPNANAVTISNIPVLSNGSDDNWDTTNLEVHIFRTTNAGTTFYRVGSVTNGTTSFNDSTSDATLQTNQLIYTDDGTVEFDPVPLHKFVHIVNNIAYYGFIKEGTAEYPFRIHQSVPGAPSAAPVDFYLDVEDEITGIGSVNSIPIVFCKRHVYRLENNFDQFGRGGINPVRLSDTAGCVSHLSVVSAEGSIFWAGNDGFYSSNGYTVQKISDKINSRYRSVLDETSDHQRIYGKFDEENRRIFWAVQSDSSNDENDQLVVLDLRWGIRPHSTFTTWSGATMRISCLEFFNDKLYRADDKGYVYYHDRSLMSDPRVDSNADAEDWELETIIWNYESCNYNFGSTFFRKMPTKILLTARNISNTSIQITAVNDDGKKSRDLKIIRWRRNFVWGDEDFIWGNPDCVWRLLGLIEQWRRFPARGLRLSYLKLIITNGYSVITTSDFLGQGEFLDSDNTVTLLGAPTFEWPTSVVDYFISTEADNYVRQFQISERNSDSVITVIDAAGVLPSGTYDWKIKGYKKNEPLNLIGYCVAYAPVDQNQLTYEAGDDGGSTDV